jgi:hypothetical protein
MAEAISWNGADMSGDITTNGTIDQIPVGQTFFDVPTKTLYVCQSTNVLAAIGSSGALPAGSAGAVNSVRKVLAALTDNTFTNVCTLTVPNGIMGAGLHVSAVGILGDGDSAQMAEYNGAISRITGAATGCTLGAAIGAATNNGVTANASIAIQASANAGANSATQTFTLQMKVTKSAGSSANHVLVATVTLMNGFGSGITIF